MLGVSGSGKTKNFNDALRTLAVAGKSKKDKASQRVMKAVTVLNAFGNAATIQNVDSSRYGCVAQVQFNKRGKLSGVQLSDYLLEK